MTNFDEAMDGILVQNKILEETMNKSMGDTQQEMAVSFIFYLFFLINSIGRHYVHSNEEGIDE